MQETTVHDKYNVHYLDGDEDTSVKAAFAYLQTGKFKPIDAKDKFDNAHSDGESILTFRHEGLEHTVKIMHDGGNNFRIKPL